MIVVTGYLVLEPIWLIIALDVFRFKANLRASGRMLKMLSKHLCFWSMIASRHFPKFPQSFSVLLGGMS